MLSILSYFLMQEIVQYM